MIRLDKIMSDEEAVEARQKLEELNKRERAIHALGGRLGYSDSASRTDLSRSLTAYDEYHMLLKMTPDEKLARYGYADATPRIRALALTLLKEVHYSYFSWEIEKLINYVGNNRYLVYMVDHYDSNEWRACETEEELAAFARECYDDHDSHISEVYDLDTTTPDGCAFRFVQKMSPDVTISQLFVEENRHTDLP